MFSQTLAFCSKFWSKIISFTSFQFFNNSYYKFLPLCYAFVTSRQWAPGRHLPNLLVSNPWFYYSAPCWAYGVQICSNFESSKYQFQVCITSSTYKITNRVNLSGFLTIISFNVCAQSVHCTYVRTLIFSFLWVWQLWSSSEWIKVYNPKR